MAEFAIANLYVDKVDEGKMVEEAIIKMLEQLDPHSVYSDAEEVKKMNEPLQGLTANTAERWTALKRRR